MKIRSTSGMLSGLLEMVARAVSSRAHVQLLSAVLFEADEDANLLTMKATDMEISISLTAETPVEEGGSAAIPAKLLLQYAKSLPEGEAELETDESGTGATLSSGGSSVSLRCYSPDDFPTLPEFPEPAGGEAGGESVGGSDPDGAAPAAFSVDAAALKEAASKVLPFASKDEGRAVLTGVLVAFSEGTAALVATDSYRLGLNRQKLDGAAGSPTAILPARALQEAVRLAAKEGEDGRIEVAITENQAMFRAGEAGITLATRLIDGNYPEYQKLLPGAFEETFSVHRDALLTALARTRIVAGKQTPPPPVKLAFSHEPDTLRGGEVAISLTAETGAATEVLSADVPEGRSFEICFNPHFLADAVSSISDEAVALRFNAPLKPAVLRPATGLEEDARTGAEALGHLNLIMPMRDPNAGVTFSMGATTDYVLSLSTPAGKPLPGQVNERILADRVLDAPGFEGLREGGDPASGWLSGWDKSWEPDDDLVPLSRRTPGVLFTLWGKYAGDDEPFKTYYVGGRLQHAPARIFYEPYDPRKLTGAGEEAR